MKRLLIFGLGGLVAVVFFYFLGDIIKTAVEKTGTAVTKTAVTLDNADVDFGSGRGTLSGFRLANPDGFKSDSAFEFGAISVTVDTATVNQDPVIIKEILIDAPQITYEIGDTGSNIDRIRENVEAFQKTLGSGGGSGGGSSDASTQEGPKLIIEHIRLNNGKVRVMASQFMDNTLDAPLPNVHLTDIGKQQGGASAAEVASQTLDAVLTQVTAAVGSVDLSAITGPLGDKAAGAAKAISDSADKATKALTEGTGDPQGAIEDAAKGAKDAVKNLFGGSD